MTGQLKIYNGTSYVDAGENYGLTLSDGAFAALLAPAPLKAVVTNDSRLEHGKRYTVNTPRCDERQLTLPCHVRASSYADLIDKINALTALLLQGEVKIKVRYETGTEVGYRLIYQSCTNFTQGVGRLALLSLRFIEPDPSNHTL